MYLNVHYTRLNSFCVLPCTNKNPKLIYKLNITKTERIPR